MTSLNILVLNGFVQESDRENIFSDEEVMAVSPLTSMIDLVVRIGAFPSKSQARKNWKGASEIPDGFTEHFIGKKKRHLCIWNPSE